MDVSYEKALVHCTAQGARLCSANELQNDVARGTGCGFDTRLVWTSESCMLEPGIYGKIVTGGSSTYNGTTSAACYLKNGDIDVVAQPPGDGDDRRPLKPVGGLFLPPAT